MFSGEKKKTLRPSERRLLSDSCKMRYATIPHSSSCSEVARSDQPWGERKTFSPAAPASLQVTVWTVLQLSVKWFFMEINKPMQTGVTKNYVYLIFQFCQKVHRTSSVIRSITVFTVNESLAECDKAEDSDQFDRRVAGISLKFDDSSEDSLGNTEHHTARQQTYTLEEGELILEVHSHYPTSLLVKKNNRYQSEIFDMTNICDLSFLTNKERRLGPMKESDSTLGDGLTMKIPSKIRHLEKHCPGSFSWLQGFGSEMVTTRDKGEQMAFYPIWGFKAHFKVYPVEQQEFDFVSGFKKHYQFSLDGLSDNLSIESLEDLNQIERSPVHEVVDLEDSEESEPESTNKRKSSRVEDQNEDSIMVVDSEEEDQDEDSEEEEEDDGGGFEHGMIPQEYQPSFRGNLNKNTDGGEDEPIEIESSSEEEKEAESAEVEVKKDQNGDESFSFLLEENNKRKREGSSESKDISEETAKKSKEDKEDKE